MTDLHTMVHKYNLRKAIVDYDAKRESDDPAQNERIKDDGVEYYGANGISSLIVDGPHEGLHIPVLDIDMDCCVVPSSTYGHHHLIIGKPMRFRAYATMMESLQKAGIVEPGYVAAAMRRQETWIRTPWSRKES